MIEEYKKSLENSLIHLDYLYSGDVISSKQRIFCLKHQNLNFTSELFVSAIKDIYDCSIKDLISRSNEIVINRKDFNYLSDLYPKLGFSPTSMFFSKGYYPRRNRSLRWNLPTFESISGPIPHYFKMNFKHSNVKCYYSPIIDDSEDDCHIYFINGGIQSFVWILQNITYSINRGVLINEHLIKYPIYNCNYQSIRVRIVDNQKIREKKISQILD